MKMRMSLVKFLVVLMAISAVTGCTRIAEEEVYMFSYFRNNGEDGLHLAWSADGYTYTALNRR
jgi:hypothetical protein